MYYAYYSSISSIQFHNVVFPFLVLEMETRASHIHARQLLDHGIMPSPPRHHYHNFFVTVIKCVD